MLHASCFGFYTRTLSCIFHAYYIKYILTVIFFFIVKSDVMEISFSKTYILYLIFWISLLIGLYFVITICSEHLNRKTNYLVIVVCSGNNGINKTQIKVVIFKGCQTLIKSSLININNKSIWKLLIFNLN